VASLDDLVYLNAFAVIDLIYYQGFRSLLKEVSPKTLWQRVNKPMLEKIKVSNDLISGILKKHKVIDPQLCFDKLKSAQIKALHIDDPDYPELLREIHTPPLILYVKGSAVWKTHKNCIAIVGTRIPTSYGEAATKELVKQITKENSIVISGLATGIDTLAHRSSLENKGITIAVIGSGLDIIYPEQNSKLFHEIIRNDGAIVSEFPLGSPPIKWHFPARNRIISALAQKVVVIEGSKKSGSLITAKIALEQNKEVFALPGSIYSAMSDGPHFLINQGAKILTSANDLFEKDILKKNTIPLQEEFISNLSKEEKLIYNIVSNTRATAAIVENILDDSGLAYDKIKKTLTDLELKGVVSRLPGQRVVLV